MSGWVNSAGEIFSITAGYQHSAGHGEKRAFGLVAAAGRYCTDSRATGLQLWERYNHHHAEQAAHWARSDAPRECYMSFKWRTTGRPYHHPYRACARIMGANCEWVGNGIRKGHVPVTSFSNEGMSSDGVGGRWRRCAGVCDGCGRFGLTHAAGF